MFVQNRQDMKITSACNCTVLTVAAHAFCEILAQLAACLSSAAFAAIIKVRTAINTSSEQLLNFQ